jgi:rpsU-divergently transcribed protein
MISIYTVKWGFKYNSEHVNLILEQCREYISTDFNFYSKRITLAKVITRCFLFYVNDESDNSLKTQNFIDSQINKIITFEV